LIGCPAVFFFPINESFFFSASGSAGDFFFGLPILDRIESPIAVVTMRIYSDLGVDFMDDL
jgi:hypothetical protein